MKLKVKGLWGLEVKTMINILAFLLPLFLIGCVDGGASLEDNKPPVNVKLSIPPNPGDAAIVKALALFKIEVPDSVKVIRYDPRMTDFRGLIEAKFSKTMQTYHIVSIGPLAFKSWALLGSTLAHEIEVHAHQNIRMAHLLSMAGGSAVKQMEIKAYTYEIENAKRFGLSAGEVNSIRYTMQQMYMD